MNIVSKRSGELFEIFLNWQKLIKAAHSVEGPP